MTLPAGVNSGDPGNLLLDLMRGQPLEGLEQSFKMSAGTFLANRYLMGMRKPEASLDGLLGTCAKIGMPAEYQARFRENFPAADTIHLGFEENASGRMYKAYLEFWGDLNAALASNPGLPDPVLLYLAFKWDALDAGKRAVASYHCHPRLPVDGILERMARIHEGQAHAASDEAANGLIRLAGSAGVLPMYLEVSETGSPRLSFDLNVYDARLRLGEIGHLLERARMRYAIDEGAYRTVFEKIRGATLGHLSGGIGRDGRDFLTVYYEAGGQ